MLGPDSEYLPAHPKAEFWRPSVKICKIPAVKHPVEKPILPSEFVSNPLSKNVVVNATRKWKGKIVLHLFLWSFFQFIRVG